MKRILFVCTGNTCRSPMAEAILRALSRERSLELDIRSAGVSTIDGLPVSNHAQKVLSRRDIAHSGTSKALEGGSVAWADLILTMTGSHKRKLLEHYPSAVDKTHTLLEFVNTDPKVLANIAELEGLYSSWHIKQALGQQLSEEERTRLLELERQMPSFDVDDPFGGSLEVYEQSAAQLEAALRRLLDRLQG
ncbi:low molecular weight protein arginine phosphatase [Paenibacillus montanisoli]|uniref:Low molecular weight protein arginine phosphatase n=1 Tax=Paenibacillus montanisoli TaxID=2081970 RepID=A0A328TU19_9BACL|nr:low molecular weight protein arginine phosphatase [Paenibacillus montanisoli]RAP74038.1 low molecular weight protein arginine phosphatase [Paenibacillus montanisoli]